MVTAAVRILARRCGGGGRTTALRRASAQSAADGEVRVRFAPSPTGRMHLGSLRTALFNFLFARSHGGAFVLRIEDTDRQRTVPGCAQEIERILDDYGLKRDEGPKEGGSFGPYRQSERAHLYRDAVAQLIDEGHAYRCFCTAERLDIIRRQAHQNKTNPRYDGRCRSLDADESKRRAASEPHVVRFKFPPGLVQFEDTSYGRVDYAVDEGDFVVLKQDGFPTYHLANVVDDRAMRISHVIRGQEWLASTPKHIRLYEAFHSAPPQWVHLPLIMRDAKHKLSKRDEDAFVDYYHEQKGYLRSAVLNFLLRNGSGLRNFDSFRFYSLDDMIRDFDAQKIGTRSLQLDLFALNSYGRRSIRRAKYEELYAEIRAFLQRHAPDCEPHLLSDAYLRKALDFLLHNEEDFSHLAQLVKPAHGKDRFSFLFTKPHAAIRPLPEYGHLGTRRILDHLLDLPDREWTLRGLKQAAQDVGIPYTKLFALFRSAVINNNGGPPVMELIDFFGVSECRKRVQDQVKWLADAAESADPEPRLKTGGSQ
ncbi:Glutamyl-tRNA synthetase [Aphelenchoides fujianensis]|nr:Glutamyl-tRNA synthetase [Aphelenchoides fujianensis]